MTDISVATAMATVVAIVAGYFLGRWSTQEAVSQAGRAKTEISGLTTQLETALTEADSLRKELNSLKDADGIKAQELVTLNLRLDAAEILRTDYRQAKVRGGEADRLRDQVNTLESELSSLGSLEDLTPLGEDTEARENARSLQEAVSSLLNEEIFAATIVDSSGLQMVSAGLADDALAAFSVLLAEACARATAFVPISDPYIITLIDGAGSRVSLWPFEVSNKPMALVTLSKQPPATAAVNTTISKVKALLPKSFRTLATAS